MHLGDVAGQHEQTEQREHDDRGDIDEHQLARRVAPFESAEKDRQGVGAVVYVLITHTATVAGEATPDMALEADSPLHLWVYAPASGAGRTTSRVAEVEPPGRRRRSVEPRRSIPDPRAHSSANLEVST